MERIAGRCFEAIGSERGVGERRKVKGSREETTFGRERADLIYAGCLQHSSTGRRLGRHISKVVANVSQWSSKHHKRVIYRFAISFRALAVIVRSNRAHVRLRTGLQEGGWRKDDIEQSVAVAVFLMLLHYCWLLCMRTFEKAGSESTEFQTSPSSFELEAFWLTLPSNCLFRQQPWRACATQGSSKQQTTIREKAAATSYGVRILSVLQLLSCAQL